MARIRTIKPEFAMDEDLSSLPPETHLLAATLLPYADDEGYFKAHPKLVEAHCCPLRDDATSVRDSIQQLHKVGYIELFTGTDGKEYGHILNFIKHQRVSHPATSKIRELHPLHGDSTDTPEGDGNAPEDTRREGKGREGKRKCNGVAHFDSFWTAYPSKKGKKPAQEKWKAKGLDAKADTIIADVTARAKRDKQWLNGYIPNPATYLNQERWEDEWEATSEPNPSEGVL